MKSHLWSLKVIQASSYLDDPAIVKSKNIIQCKILIKIEVIITKTEVA